MDFAHEIVDKKGIRPILADKILYYADPVFVDRLKQVSPSLRALGNALPTKDQLDQVRLDGELAIPVGALFIDLGAGQNPVNESENNSASDADQGGSTLLLQPKPVQTPVDPLVAAATRKLALDLADWSAFSTADEVKSHVLKTLFMQDFMGEKRHVSI